MSIMWKYLDKRQAAIAAIKDYESMQFILRTTDDEIRKEYNRATQKYGKQMQGKRSFLASFLSGFKQSRNKYTAPAKRGKSKILLFSRIESDERRAQSFDEMGNERLKHDKRRVIWKTILLSKERRHSA